VGVEALKGSQFQDQRRTPIATANVLGTFSTTLRDVGGFTKLAQPMDANISGRADIVVSS
jgi:hypothetical protein